MTGEARQDRRTFTITDDLIVRYSRRGNFHSEASDPAAIALGGLVAQGTQVCGPAYAALLDTWGAEFLDHGELDLRFVGMVLGGDTIDTVVDFDDSDIDGANVGVGVGEAKIDVRNASRDRTAAVGTARCRGSVNFGGAR